MALLALLHACFIWLAWSEAPRLAGVLLMHGAAVQYAGTASV
jgi:hypothetical protein